MPPQGPNAPTRRRSAPLPSGKARHRVDVVSAVAHAVAAATPRVQAKPTTIGANTIAQGPAAALLGAAAGVQRARRVRVTRSRHERPLYSPKPGLTHTLQAAVAADRILDSTGQSLHEFQLMQGAQTASDTAGALTHALQVAGMSSKRRVDASIKAGVKRPSLLDYAISPLPLRTLIGTGDALAHGIAKAAIGGGLNVVTGGYAGQTGDLGGVPDVAANLLKDYIELPVLAPALVATAANDAIHGDFKQLWEDTGGGIVNTIKDPWTAFKADPLFTASILRGAAAIPGRAAGATMRTGVLGKGAKQVASQARPIRSTINGITEDRRRYSPNVLAKGGQVLGEKMTTSALMRAHRAEAERLRTGAVQRTQDARDLQAAGKPEKAQEQAQIAEQRIEQAKAIEDMVSSGELRTLLSDLPMRHGFALLPGGKDGTGRLKLGGRKPVGRVGRLTKTLQTHATHANETAQNVFRADIEDGVRSIVRALPRHGPSPQILGKRPNIVIDKSASKLVPYLADGTIESVKPFMRDGERITPRRAMEIELKRLQDANKEIVGDDLRAQNEKNQTYIKNLLKDENLWREDGTLTKRALKAEQAAKEIKPFADAASMELVELKHLIHDQAEKAPLIHYAIIHLGARLGHSVAKVRWEAAKALHEQRVTELAAAETAHRAAKAASARAAREHLRTIGDAKASAAREKSSPQLDALKRRERQAQGELTRARRAERSAARKVSHKIGAREVAARRALRDHYAHDKRHRELTEERREVNARKRKLRESKRQHPDDREIAADLKAASARARELTGAIIAREEEIKPSVDLENRKVHGRDVLKARRRVASAKATPVFSKATQRMERAAEELVPKPGRLDTKQSHVMGVQAKLDDIRAGIAAERKRLSGVSTETRPATRRPPLIDFGAAPNRGRHSAVQLSPLSLAAHRRGTPRPVLSPYDRLMNASDALDKARHDEGRARDRVPEARKAAYEAKLEAARLRPTEAEAEGLVLPNGDHLPVERIREEMVKRFGGGKEGERLADELQSRISYVSRHPLGDSTFFRESTKTANRPRGEFRNTGEASRLGFSEPGVNQLVHSHVLARGKASQIASLNNLVEQYSMRGPDGMPYVLAKDAMDHIERMGAGPGAAPWVMELVAVNLAHPYETSKRLEDLHDVLDLPTVDQFEYRYLSELGRSLTRKETEAYKPDDKGRFVLMPRVFVERLKKHQDLLDQNEINRAFRSYTQLFRNTVLPLSSKWIMGNLVEGLVRLASAGVTPLSLSTYLAVSKRANELAKHPESPEAKAFAAKYGKAITERDVRRYFESVIVGGHIGGTYSRYVRRSSGKYEPGPLAEASKLAQMMFHDEIRAFDGRQIARFIHFAIKNLTRIPVSLNRRAENVMQRAAFGKELRNQWRDHRHDYEAAWRLSTPAVDDLIHGLLNTSRQVEYARAVDKVLGNYVHLPPNLRLIQSSYAPFAAWVVNSLYFINVTLPKRPIQLAALSSMDVSQRDDLRKLGVKLPQEGPVRLSYLSGYQPGQPPWVRYTFSGVFQNPAGVLAETLAVPQFRGPVFAFGGKSPFGEDIKLSSGEDPTLGWSVLMGLNAIAESIVPGLSQFRRVLEGGAPSAADSFAVAPRVRKGYERGPLSAGSRSVYDPLKPYRAHTESGGGSSSDFTGGGGDFTNGSGAAGWSP